LTMDVSGSVDAGEYRMQADGLAAALADPAIVDVLVEGRAALAVMQWSGVAQQALVVPWRRIAGPDDAARLAGEVQRMERVYYASDTAVGDAIAFAAGRFGPVADCRRHVIDISGDGAANAGRPTGAARQAAARAGIEINAVAIEGIGVAITEFFRRAAITRGGFVLTARGHIDYARAIRDKLFRELVRPSG
ncbi:MAG: DUF1194 domain-containing protein, partial [Rhodobacteraceae bacterium]|nr:DUF1194 domain-containing protein [Paracoccaceae bacterium]